MRTRVIIDPKTGKRTNETEYPIMALREAIANALIHRDYSVQTENAFIQVYMYDDRIVIQNPGSLYGINKLEKLGTDTIMESRNPTIIRLLEEKSSVIENRHSGIPTMKREMKKYSLPEPEFYEERGSFKVVFRNKNVTQSDTQTIIISDITNKILKYCEKPKTAQEIRDYLGLSSKRYVAYKIIRPLINNGSLDYTNKKSVNAKNQKYIATRKSI